MSNLVSVIDQSTRLGAKSKSAYTACVRRFVAFAGEDPSNWNGHVVERWRDSLVGRGLGHRTVNKHLYALRYASGRLEGLGIGRDFARAAETMPSPKDRHRRALSLDEVSALLSTCDAGTPPDLRDRAAIVIALRTGLRRENIIALDAAHFEGSTFHCVVKGGKRHQVVFDEDALAALDAWTTWLYETGAPRRGGALRQVRRALDGSWLVGPPIRRPAWFNEMITARAAAAELRRAIHPHLFRHTFVTWALDSGVPPHRVMAMTGQSDMATLSKYAHDLAAAADPVGSYLPRFR